MHVHYGDYCDVCMQGYPSYLLEDGPNLITFQVCLLKKKKIGIQILGAHVSPGPV